MVGMRKKNGLSCNVQTYTQHPAYTIELPLTGKHKACLSYGASYGHDGSVRFRYPKNCNCNDPRSDPAGDEREPENAVLDIVSVETKYALA